MKIDLTLISIPLISALIGWFTNWVAVKMLFHPREPLYVFGFNAQGVFPKRQKALAEKLGEIVSKELITPKDLAGALTDGMSSDKNKTVLKTAVQQVLTKSLPEKFPLLAMILNQDLAERIASVFADSFASTFGAVASEVNLNLVDETGIRKIVEQKVNSFSSDKLEQLLVNIMRREFQFIEILGGVLGFLIGLIQVLIVFMRL